MNVAQIAPTDFPLAQNIAFRSTDLDELEYFLDSGGMVEKRELTLLEKSSKVNVHISHGRLTRLHLMGVHLGASLITRSVPLRFAQIVIPVQGRLVDRTLGEPIVAKCGLSAIVHMPDRPVDVQWDVNTSALVVRIPVEYFKGVYQSLTQEELPSDFQLRPCFNLNSSEGQSFLNIVQNLISVINTSEGRFQNNRLVSLWEELLVTTLLTADAAVSERMTDHTHAQPLYGYVKRTTDYIMDNISEPFSIQELIRHAGVSLRTLQNGFKKSHGMGPMTFVREKKLKCVYVELLKSSSSDVTIADVAAKWGFMHASHFTRIYKNQFNELPSETLTKESSSVVVSTV
ncbi:MAG: AraC family transcriptional regulator [Gammaproteobacteria bacterium]|jgi:AraC-like DNA-binding protein|nr:AraC family transcriptional regulator [Gammaproteobacteria bacterium]